MDISEETNSALSMGAVQPHYAVVVAVRWVVEETKLLRVFLAWELGQSRKALRPTFSPSVPIGCSSPPACLPAVPLT